MEEPSRIRLEDLCRDFARDGFVNAGTVLSEGEIEELREETERYVDTLFRGQNRGVEMPPYAGNYSQDPAQKHYQIAGLWMVSTPFKRLVQHPRIAEVAAHLARSPTMQLWCDTLQYKTPKEGAPFHWHQDAPYHMSIEPPERLVGAWVALDDADEESGCMWMVPGSFRWGEREHHLWSFRRTVTELGDFANIRPPPGAEQAEAEWQPPVPRRVRAGEVHFHHALTWHGSPTNRGERIRRGYSMFLMPEGTRVSATFDHRIPVPQGTPMIEAGESFPIVYGERQAS